MRDFGQQLGAVDHGQPPGQPARELFGGVLRQRHLLPDARTERLHRRERLVYIPHHALHKAQRLRDGQQGHQAVAERRAGLAAELEDEGGDAVGAGRRQQTAAGGQHQLLGRRGEPLLERR